MNTQEDLIEMNKRQALADIEDGHSYSWKNATENCITSSEIREIRNMLKMTQVEFSSLFHITLSTLRSWEQGRKKPNALSGMLLLMIKRDPDGMQKRINDVLKSSLTEDDKID